MTMICAPCLSSKRVKKCPFMLRQRTLQKCAGQFTRELNIDQILKKVRDTYAMITNLP